MSSQNTAPDGSGQSALAIRWVFPTSRGILTRLSDERIVLGRDDACPVRLPGKETSRQHAEIRRDGPVYILRDLDSRNGVFVNGAQVNEAPITCGQVLRLGEWIGVAIEVAEDSPEPEPVFDLLATGLAGGPVLRPILDEARRAASRNPRRRAVVPHPRMGAEHGDVRRWRRQGAADIMWW